MAEFTGFTYNGIHSSKYHILRVSNSNRYNLGLAPSMTEQTGIATGRDGSFYFGTTYKQKDITIDFAFDSVTDSDISGLKQWLNGKNIAPLIFDEMPDRAYSAKVSGAPTFKFVCFDGPNGGRIYKGEGNIKFVCFYPFARALSESTVPFIYTVQGQRQTKYERVVGGEAPTPFIYETTVARDYLRNAAIGFGDYILYLAEPLTNARLRWDSHTGIVKRLDTGAPIPFSGCSMVELLPGEIISLPENSNAKITFYNQYY